MSVHITIDPNASVELQYGVGWNWFDFFGTNTIYGRSSGIPAQTDIDAFVGG